MKNERKNRQDTALDRRRFLRLAGTAAAGGTAAAVMPAWAKGADKREPFSRSSRGSGRGFWQRISHEFLLDPRTTYMNIGTTGSMPRHVIANYDRYNKLVARDPWDMGG
ncbi:hypothetical protein [Thiolapillus sp.]|uniref:hypothetical protein n=1 Tax=Thiolapillus sp. TaxID=2017437 RepID=UPI0025F19EFA|nr:hypothetical protein [Thiolapillus sp.]